MIENYDVPSYYIKVWTGNGELENYIYWINNSYGLGNGYYYDKGSGTYLYQEGDSLPFHTNEILFTFNN